MPAWTLDRFTRHNSQVYLPPDLLGRLDAAVSNIEAGSRRQWIAEACWQLCQHIDNSKHEHPYGPSRIEKGGRAKQNYHIDGRRPVPVQFSKPLKMTIKRCAHYSNLSVSAFVAQAIEMRLRLDGIEGAEMGMYKRQACEAWTPEGERQ
jgi:hypothetical protein